MKINTLAIRQMSLLKVYYSVVMMSKNNKSATDYFYVLFDVKSGEVNSPRNGNQVQGEVEGHPAHAKEFINSSFTIISQDVGLKFNLLVPSTASFYWAVHR